ncbi:hypothetical protein [Streptomyces decoyicus]|uniref:hypothetical protein n=1 Tax=Streptomyces decoyicus TaxID=249567 RepID=UPI002F909A2E
MNTRTTQYDNQAMQALSDAGAQCGSCGDEPGDRTCPDCERCYQSYVDALRKAGWAPRTEALREAYEAVQDPKQHAAVGGGVGWETARDVLHRLMTKTQARP